MNKDDVSKSEEEKRQVEDLVLESEVELIPPKLEERFDVVDVIGGVAVSPTQVNVVTGTAL